MGLQQKVHSEIDQPFPSDFVKNTQVSNQFILGTLTEVARPSALSPSTNIRPFAEVQTGIEDLIRIGLDVGLFGDLSEALLARAPVSGQRYRQGRRRVFIQRRRGCDTSYRLTDFIRQCLARF